MISSFRHYARAYRAGLAFGTTGAILVIFIILLWRGAAEIYGAGLHALTPDQQEKAIDDIRGRMLQVGAGLLAAGALVYTALNFRLSREGHVTERLTKATEQLGSERLEVRLGGIYALERIMVDSQRDHGTVVEVLCAFIREHSAIDTEGKIGQQSHDGNAEQEIVVRAGPATDVRAALTVLGRRPTGRDERGRVALPGTNMRGVDLQGAMLIGADLSGVDLAGANLVDSDLSDAHLARAKLVSANFSSARLNRAILSGADLTGACLNRADMKGVRLFRANLTRASLISADLSSANLVHANLTDADIDDASMDKVDLTGANLTGVNLQRAKKVGKS
jgi:uncharacterized protein YjbI with pentapeptide repeats